MFSSNVSPLRYADRTDRALEVGGPLATVESLFQPAAGQRQMQLLSVITELGPLDPVERFLDLSSGGGE